MLSNVQVLETNAPSCIAMRHFIQVKTMHNDEKSNDHSCVNVFFSCN